MGKQKGQDYGHRGQKLIDHIIRWLDHNIDEAHNNSRG